MCKKKEGVEVMAAVLVHTSMLRLLHQRPSPLVPQARVTRDQKKRRKHARYRLCTVCVLLLACPNLPQVELRTKSKFLLPAPVRTKKETYLKLLALENVSVSTARLTWSAADNSVETTCSELGLKQGINLRFYSGKYVRI